MAEANVLQQVLERYGLVEARIELLQSLGNYIYRLR
jgi:hypothetical protein